MVLQKADADPARARLADRLTTEQQLGLARARAQQMLDEQAKCWTDALRPELAAQGIRFLEPTEYHDNLSLFLAGHFQREIAPVLTPLAFDPGHPFPHSSNRSKNFAVAIKHEGRTKFARIKLPPVLPRFIQLPAAFAGGGTAFVFIEDVVCANGRSSTANGVHPIFPSRASCSLPSS